MGCIAVNVGFISKPLKVEIDVDLSILTTSLPFAMIPVSMSHLLAESIIIS